jgi:uncharacterized protein (DUF433 family)/DNA-binding transcriptional MerR regulator
MGSLLPLQNNLGVGVYSYPDAARLVGSTSGEIRRWLKGYGRRDNGIPSHAPLWTPQLEGTGIDGIGFRDLIELRFIRTFSQAGVPLNLIRRTIDELRDRLGKQYPFTSTRFKTDGRRIFMELMGDSGDPALVDVLKRQDVMKRIIDPSLREGIELDVDDQAARWFPLKGSHSVVLDPDRRFGQPILSDSGVPTAAIADALASHGNDVRLVARLYEIPALDVRKAMSFENRMTVA